MWYVNSLLCYTERGRDQMAMWYFVRGEPVTIRPVEQDERGAYIIPITDPEET